MDTAHNHDTTANRAPGEAILASALAKGQPLIPEAREACLRLVSMALKAAPSFPDDVMRAFALAACTARENAKALAMSR